MRAASRAGFEATGLPWPPTKLAVALSGGADSLALTLLAHRVAQDEGIALSAFTVDHRLRAESAAEAAAVHDQMQSLGVPHRVLVWHHDALSGNLPATARAARYDLLIEACQREGIPALLLGHHADDQAETLLHQLVRGSGVDGLSAMPPARWLRGVLLLRPLLDVPKSALEAVCESHGVTWIEDQSNDDPRFARTLLRRLLAEFSDHGFSSARLAETSGHMARARAALEGMTDGILREKRAMDGGYVLPLPLWRAAPEDIRLRALRALATELGDPEPPRFESLMRLAEAMMQAESGKQTLHRLVWHWRNAQILVRPESSSIPLQAPSPRPI